MADINITQKIIAFEYLIDQFYTWHFEHEHGGSDPRFSILKLIKLNFFVAAITSSHDNLGLLKLFDNFYALPFGHVESDVYRNRNSLTNYEFEGMYLKRIEQVSQKQNYSLISEYKKGLDSGVELLKHSNPDLIVMPPMGLVDISHRWFSWKYSYKKAQKSHRNSEFIIPDLIQQDVKFFTL